MLHWPYLLDWSVPGQHLAIDKDLAAIHVGAVGVHVGIALGDLRRR